MSITVLQFCPEMPINIDNATLPLSNRLFQNYPNPFNPITTISYQLSASTHVSLSVFDLNGRLVQKLISEYRTAGIHTVTFNAQDLASGVFLVQLIAGDNIDVKKVQLLK
jgi:hypothetical protein